MTVPYETYEARLRETLPRVRDVMGEAAHAAGRDAASVRLVAVTKGHPVAAVRAALAAGLSDLGENRVEELAEKTELVGASAHGPVPRWHMIGHIQSRKAASAAALADMIHSVDSVRLAERLSGAAPAEGGKLEVLVQVNTSGEEAKFGFPVEEAEEAVLRIAELPGLEVRGLMTMAPLTDDQAVLRRTFAGLRRLRERIRSVSPRVGEELSMGMTNDLAVAIREGSTMVRIGTALFGERGR